MGEAIMRLSQDDVALLVDALRISGGFKSDYRHLQRCASLAKRLAAWQEDQWPHEARRAAQEEGEAG
jgi:hypothetical protein